MDLSAAEKLRYSRQMILAEIGAEGQLKLKRASILIVGLGGLGSPAALYLAAAGVGRIGMIDYDQIDISNLHRQILYDTSQVGQQKAKAAAERLCKLNPEIKIESYTERLSLENALPLFEKYDIILDGADNFATRFLVNDAAFFANRPLISASILSFEGQFSVFCDGEAGPCYRCLYPEPPPAGTTQSCAEAGVLGALPGFVGSLQAAEALKRILGIGESLTGFMIVFNVLNMEFHKLSISKDPNCPLCGADPKIKNLTEENFVCATDVNTQILQMTAQELSAILSKKTIQLLDVREEYELGICKLPFTHHISVKELEANLHKLSKETPVVVYCKSGARSMRACTLLKSKGFQVQNLDGGILAWANLIDRQMQKY